MADDNESKTGRKTGGTRKAASRKSASKKTGSRKTSSKAKASSTTRKKRPAAKKGPAAKKAGSRKTTARKTAARKATARKTTARKTTARKAGSRKTASSASSERSGRSTRSTQRNARSGSSGGVRATRAPRRAASGARGEAPNASPENRRFLEENREGLSKTAQRAKWIQHAGEHADRPGETLATRSHEAIRAWAEERGAQPATVGREGSEIRVLRFDFPDFGGASLRTIDWDEWFGVFDDRNLVFLFQETMKDGSTSNFFRLDSPEREEG